ncbi:hypothetical protein [Coleofasciculus sp. B1-GNL1-01]|uniref:hypothetical protein n=1 Tax=Coleofasciculus sp. B1-GNL1-01 TaxID=3068484 RepID=UPI0040640C21
MIYEDKLTMRYWVYIRFYQYIESKNPLIADSANNLAVLRIKHYKYYTPISTTQFWQRHRLLI